MPSYRLHVPIGALRPGSSPAEVMEQAVLALGTLHVLEQQEVEAPVLEGRRVGRLALRFAVDASTRAAEDAAARHALAVVIEHLEDTAAQVAPLRAVQLTRGAGGRFRPIPVMLER